MTKMYMKVNNEGWLVDADECLHFGRCENGKKNSIEFCEILVKFVLHHNHLLSSTNTDFVKMYKFKCRVRKSEK